MIKPFIKWVGGKTQLLNDIKNYLPDNLESIDTYIEPFIGGGAVLFYIVPLLPNVKHVIINDLNYKLINTYQVIKDYIAELLSVLRTMQNDYYQTSNKEEFFYKIRESFNVYDTSITNANIIHAAEFIFLNKTCFNGLYRENKKGDFNTPWNKSEHPCICDSSNLIKVHEFLNRYHVHIYTGTYKELFDNHINLTDYNRSLVYFDPPYRPLTKSAAFTAYTKSGFNDDNQKELKTYCDKIHNVSHYFILSNSDPKNSDPTDNFFDNLYKDYEINRVYARRNINSKGDSRSKISEILVRNYYSL